MNDSVKKLIDKYIANNEYEKCNEILKKEITYYFVKKIQKTDDSFLYSSLVELLESSEEYLEKHEVMILENFYKIVKMDYTEDFLYEELILTYEKIQEIGL